MWYWQNETITGKHIPGAGFLYSSIAVFGIGFGMTIVWIFGIKVLFSVTTLMAVVG